MLNGKLASPPVAERGTSTLRRRASAGPLMKVTMRAPTVSKTVWEGSARAGSASAGVAMLCSAAGTAAIACGPPDRMLWTWPAWALRAWPTAAA